MATVAVLMSTYNGEKYLRAQLDSVLSQKEVDIKLVVRDDGSSDTTLNILQEYASADKRIIILNEANCGAEMSFHHLCGFACQNTNADYYAFCDQDDVWLPEKLSTAIKHLEQFDYLAPALYFSNLRMVDSELKDIRNLFSDDEVVVSKHMALIQIFTYGCTCVFNRPAIEAYCRTDFSRELAHDNWIYVICMFLGNVFYDNSPHILYRQHGSNLSGKKVSGFKLAYRRFRRALRGHWGRDFELYATSLLNIFSDRILPEDRLYISHIANYRKSFRKKLSLLFSESYTTGHFSKDIAIKTRILFNRL